MESSTQINVSCSLFSVVYQKEKPVFFMNRVRDVTPTRERNKSKLTLSKSYYEKKKAEENK